MPLKILCAYLGPSCPATLSDTLVLEVFELVVRVVLEVLDVLEVQDAKVVLELQKFKRCKRFTS